MGIRISKEQGEKCLEFAKAFILKEKSGLDFGNTRLPRVEIDRVADCAEGKVGELVFKEFCKARGVVIDVDFGLTHGRHSIDYGQDIETVDINGQTCLLIPRVDIKTSRSYSNWLLVEDHKMWASIIVFITVDLPRRTESDLSVFGAGIEGEFRGFIYWLDLFDTNNEPWFIFEEGQKLLNPKFVIDMYKKAKGSGKSISNKCQLKQAYKDTVGKFGDQFIGPPLKCPKQYGLPVPLLRKSEYEIGQLINLLKHSVIPMGGKGELTHNR